MSARFRVLVLLFALALIVLVLRRLGDEGRDRLLQIAFAAQSASRTVREVVEALLDVWAGQD